MSISVGDRVLIDHAAIINDVKNLYQSLLNDFGIRGSFSETIEIDSAKLQANLINYTDSLGRPQTIDGLKEARKVVAVFSDPPGRDWAVCAFDWDWAGIEPEEVDEGFPQPVVVSVDLLKKVP